MSDTVTKDDLVLVEKLARLLSYKATMTHGAAWEAVLAENEMTDDAFMAAYGQIVRRFADEPALADAYAKLYQEQTAERFREAAEAKGVNADPQLAASQWNAVHDIEDKAQGFAQQYTVAATEAPAPGYAPNLELIARAATDPSRENIGMLLDDRGTVFHIDWREAPLDIIDICGHRLPESTLAIAELNLEGVTLACGERTVAVELTETPADREAMLRACNRVLQPDYEIRVCLDSLGSDTLAFVCLRAEDWSELEQRHGARLSARFAALAEQPLFD